jgi:hypothetical protein
MGLKQKSVTTGGLTPREILWLSGDRDGYEAALKPWEFGQEETDLIDEHGDAALAAYAKAHPGRRPWWFWNCCELPEETRHRLGGIGDERRNDGRRYLDFGVPVDRSWNLRGDQRYAGQHDGVPIDPDNPPLYESESNFLRRHLLLLSGEEKKLTAADFAPVSVLDIGAWRHRDEVHDDPAGPWPPTSDWYDGSR